MNGVCVVKLIFSRIKTMFGDQIKQEALDKKVAELLSAITLGGRPLFG